MLAYKYQFCGQTQAGFTLGKTMDASYPPPGRGAPLEGGGESPQGPGRVLGPGVRDASARCMSAARGQGLCPTSRAGATVKSEVTLATFLHTR